MSGQQVSHPGGASVAAGAPLCVSSDLGHSDGRDVDEDEFNALADELRASWEGDRERWHRIREELTERSLCLRWDGDYRLLLEQHTDRQSALIATTYGRPQADRIRYAILLERSLRTGRMEIKERERS